ncbi:MAG: hypothetical protein WBN75_04020 [Verrucomicrobiia bacterium]
MQNIVIEKPYRFVPPQRGRFWHALFGLYLPHYLNRNHGITSVECRGTELLRRSLATGHGILLTANHCRPSDPMTLGMLSLRVRQPFFMMADLYLAQQLSCYPPDYIRSRPTPERLLETVERFEEDLTDRTRIHRPLHAIIEVGKALSVSSGRERGGGPDPLMEKIREQLETMLERSGVVGAGF